MGRKSPDPFGSRAYVFSNRRRCCGKDPVLLAQRSLLLIKRPSAEMILTPTAEQLHWLLEGIDIAVVQH